MTKDQAVTHFGSVSALAAGLRVSYQAVHRWSQVPALRQLQLEKMTAGALKADLVSMPEATPTLNVNLRPNLPGRQSTVGAGVLSSSAGAA